MHFNKCLQMFPCPWHILIVTAPNWSSIVHYNESEMARGGGSESWAAAGAPGRFWMPRVLPLPCPEPHATGKARMPPGGSITQSMSKQPPECQSDRSWLEGGRPGFELIMATMYYCYYYMSDIELSISDPP